MKLRDEMIHPLFSGGLLILPCNTQEMHRLQIVSGSSWQEKRNERKCPYL
jgi:hypothetical protein